MRTDERRGNLLARRCGCGILISSILFGLLLISSTVIANEALQIASMGGAFVGLQSFEGGIFGNPAGLISVQDNNLSLALSVQNLDYESLPRSEDQRTNTWVSVRLGPSIYYSGTVKGVGVGLGYVEDLDSRSIIRVDKTKAVYIADERMLVSDTNTVMDYDFFRDSRVVLSFGRRVGTDLAIGAKLKYRHRTIKEGIIYRPLHLTAVHEEDVNRNDPAKLLPAIIDNLDITDAIDRFKSGADSREDVMADMSGGGLDLDFGMQAKLSSSWNVLAGFMLEHLIQSRIVKPQPSAIRLGIGARPVKWMAAAVDFQKALSGSGVNVNVGWEIHHRWSRWFSGGIIVRNGFAHESSTDLSAGPAKDKLTIGIGLILGDSHWDYTLVRPLDSSPLRKATHMLSSRIGFR